MSRASIVAGNTNHTAPENRVFYPALDGLRAIAFLMVLAQHYMSMPWGWTGVNVFFVLSGFLITGILWDTREDQHRARNFYVRRTLRIFPLYYGIFLLLAVTWPLAHWHFTRYWLAWPLYLGNFLRFLSPAALVVNTPLELAADAHLKSHLLQGELYLGHFWSLCVEEQFYLVWPWVVFWCRSKRALQWLCVVVILATPIARVLCVEHAPLWMNQLELTYRFTPLQLDSLLLGALAAFLLRGEHRNLLIKAAGWVAALFGAVVLVSLAITVCAAGSFQEYVYPAWKQTWGLCAVNVLTVSIILAVLRPKTLLARLLAFSPLRWLGRISYGAYIFHDLLHFAFAHVTRKSRLPFVAEHNGAATFLLALVGTTVLAWLSFRFFESPFLNLKEKFTVRPLAQR
ncbi:MAG: acyltransferase [Acidobacteriaceae bacterium]|nr:acyltransferase [Acidobacteriaceae bacterium]